MHPRRAEDRALHAGSRSPARATVPAHAAVVRGEQGHHPPRRAHMRHGQGTVLEDESAHGARHPRRVGSSGSAIGIPVRTELRGGDHEGKSDDFGGGERRDIQRGEDTTNA